jgi:hypothetical protein
MFEDQSHTIIPFTLQAGRTLYVIPPSIQSFSRLLSSLQTGSFLINFVAAMVINPNAQARAQQELDTVLGHTTLPRISDRERLPYIRNLIDEVLRLYPVLPLGEPI